MYCMWGGEQRTVKKRKRDGNSNVCCAENKKINSKMRWNEGQKM